METIENWIEIRKTLSKAQKTTLKAYLKTLHNTSERVRYVYVTRMRKFGEFINKPYEQVTKADIDNFLSGIKNDATYDSYVQTLKSFYNGFLHKKKAVTHLKKRNKLKNFTPGELLTVDEVVKVANAMASEMLKVFVLVLFESCARISEVLSLRIGDIEFSSVKTKSGELSLVATLHFQRSKGNIPKQPVVISMFATELKRWIESHPHKNNPDAYVFYPRKFHPDASVPLNSRTIDAKLAIAKEYVGIKKKTNPHWFRHSGLSYCSNELNYNEQLLMWRAGWKNTVMARRYIHSGAELQNSAYLQKMGYEISAKPPQTVKPKPCPHCNKLNPYTNINCDACGMPLDLAKYKETLEKKHLTTVGLEEIQKQMNQMWCKLEELALTLKARNQELIIQYIASKNPTNEELERFLEEQRIDKRVLEEIESIVPHNGQWYFIDKQ